MAIRGYLGKSLGGLGFRVWGRGFRVEMGRASNGNKFMVYCSILCIYSCIYSGIS